MSHRAWAARPGEKSTPPRPFTLTVSIPLASNATVQREKLMIRVLSSKDQVILRESPARSVGDQPDMTVVAAIADASECFGRCAQGASGHDTDGCVYRARFQRYVAAARIKEQLPECRVIIMTGMPEITFVDHAREAGVDSFVYKNVGIDELFLP